MGDLLGQQLVKEKVVTNKQLEKALKRQRLHGGRLGYNLVSLGYITTEKLDTFFKIQPPAPKSIEETGLNPTFISELALKHVLFMGEFKLGELSEALRLPIEIVDSVIETLRKERSVEVKGAAQFARLTYKFSVTEPGKARAYELLEQCRYVGPAPVTLEDYRKIIEFQTIKNIVVTEASVAKAFEHLVTSQDFLKSMGPAINSGRALFLYGPPGNGKTTIAETIGNVLPGTVYLPHALIVGGQIISVFDPVSHIPAEPELSPGDVDQRWLLIKRPVIMTGGELALRMLDLDINPVTKFYVAPLQMKANNGLFIVDDFGRQQIPPENLLNRWIVPLERRVDFLSLHTGLKFDIPFDQITIFATNIEPQKLVDEAFLRRIRYKIKVDHPSKDEYVEIFKIVCKSNEIEFNKKIFEYLMENYYKKLDVKLNACHPRDLIDHVIDNAHYYNHPPELTRETIDAAWKNYFVDMRLV